MRKDGEEPGPRKWLEERWEVLLPRLAVIGVEQEEEMKRICQEELEVVLAAVDRVRQYFGTHFQGLRRREISQQCRPQIQEAAYKQVWSLVPLRPEERNAYKSLAHEVYPQLAAWLYCPTNVDPLVYMATIEHRRKILEATSEEERLTLALAAGYREYVVMDTQGVEDQRHGIRLGDPGVEVSLTIHSGLAERKHTRLLFLPLSRHASVLFEFPR